MIPGLNSANISGAEERLRFRQRELRDHRSKPRRRSSEKGQHHLEDPGTYRDQQWEYLAARTGTNSAASPIAARSPPMLIVFALNSSATKVVTAQVG